MIEGAILLRTWITGRSRRNNMCKYYDKDVWNKI